MQNDYKRLAHAFDKSTIAIFVRTRLNLGKTHVIRVLQIGMANHNPLCDADRHIS
jgi:hypothetical protein